MAVDARRLKTVETGIRPRGRGGSAGRPAAALDAGPEPAGRGGRSRPSAGAPADWQPGVVIRLPFSRKISRDGVLCSQALMAVGRHRDDAGLRGGVERPPADERDRSDHALPAAGEFRRAGRCAHRPHRPHHQLRPGVAVERRRPAPGRHGLERLRHVVARDSVALRAARLRPRGRNKKASGGAFEPRRLFCGQAADPVARGPILASD